MNPSRELDEKILARLRVCMNDAKEMVLWYTNVVQLFATEGSPIYGNFESFDDQMLRTVPEYYDSSLDYEFIPDVGGKPLTPPPGFYFSFEDRMHEVAPEFFPSSPSPDSDGPIVPPVPTPDPDFMITYDKEKKN